MQTTHYGFVHLEFGSTRRPASLELIARLRTALGQRHGSRTSLLIVDNALAAGTPAQSLRSGDETLRVIPGDNTNREFSGWDVGVADVLSRGEVPDVWIFTNDTVCAHHGWSPARANRFANETAALSAHAGPWMLGEVIHHPKPMRTPCGPQLDFIGTYCFAMNETLRQGLGTLSPGNALLDDFVHDAFEPAHRLFRDNVDPGYAEAQLAWLVADSDDHSKEKARRFRWSFSWHNAKPLDAGSFDDLRAKVRCIVAEHGLSVRARRLGADVRSPYDGRTARERLANTLAYFADKMWERRYLKRRMG